MFIGCFSALQPFERRSSSQAWEHKLRRRLRWEFRGRWWWWWGWGGGGGGATPWLQYALTFCNKFATDNHHIDPIVYAHNLLYPRICRCQGNQEFHGQDIRIWSLNKNKLLSNAAQYARDYGVLDSGDRDYRSITIRVHNILYSWCLLAKIRLGWSGGL